MARTNNLKLWHRPWRLAAPSLFDIFTIPPKFTSEAPLLGSLHLQEARNQALHFEPACLDLQQYPQHDAAAAEAASLALGGGEDDEEQEQQRHRHRHHHDQDHDDDEDDDKGPQMAEFQRQDVYLLMGFRQSFRYFEGRAIEDPLRRTLQFRNASLRDFARGAVESLRTKSTATSATAAAAAAAATTKTAFVVGVHVRYGMSTNQDFNGEADCTCKRGGGVRLAESRQLLIGSVT